MNYEDSIPISLLKEYSFCPRIPWYLNNSYQPVKESLWMIQGSQYHAERENLLKKRLLKKFQKQSVEIFYRVNVFSIKYKIHGILDALLKTQDNLYPVEFKMNLNLYSQGVKNQMLGYIICLEEMYQKKVSLGFIVTGKNAKVKEMKFSEEEKNQLLETIQKVKEIQKFPFLPHSPASKNKCLQCEFLNYCNDRNI